MRITLDAPDHLYKRLCAGDVRREFERELTMLCNGDVRVREMASKGRLWRATEFGGTDDKR